MGVSVPLNEGPAEKISVASYYADKNVPPILTLMLRNPVKCPKTGKVFQQTDSNHIYIAPIVG
jgi:hypothetical protein